LQQLFFSSFFFSFFFLQPIIFHFQQLTRGLWLINLFAAKTGSLCLVFLDKSASASFPERSDGECMLPHPSIYMLPVDLGRRYACGPLFLFTFVLIDDGDHIYLSIFVWMPHSPPHLLVPRHLPALSGSSSLTIDEHGAHPRLL